jgi:hypothetical protein
VTTLAPMPARSFTFDACCSACGGILLATELETVATEAVHRCRATCAACARGFVLTITMRPDRQEVDT